MGVVQPGELLERNAELSSLEACLEAVGGSAGRLALVYGEAGVGKTALLRHFCAQLPPQVRALSAACDALSTPRPLGPLLDVARVTGGELRERVERSASPPDVAVALIEELGSTVPTVLVLEDLHWADDATLDVVRLVARRIEAVPVLLIASYRAEQFGRTHPLRLLLGELPRDGIATRLELAALSRDAVAILAEALPVDVDELFGRTAGNPFFVTESLAAGTERVPPTVRDAVLARVARLPLQSRRLLDAVAIVPQPVELWLLEALLDEGLEPLDDCLNAGVLRADVDCVAFRHELARLVVEESLAPTDRRGLNRRALAALTQPAVGGPDVARLAHHAEAALDADAVLRYAPEAAERAAASRAHREAAAQFARALRFADDRPPPRRAALLRRRSEECAMTNQLDEAIDAQREALECHRRLGDRREQGDALRWLARLHILANWSRDVEPLLLEAIELLEPLPPGHELAMTYAMMALFHHAARDDYERTALWGRKALEIAEDIDDAEARVCALTYVGCAELENGKDESGAKLEQALELAQAHELEGEAARVYVMFVIGSLRLRRLDIARGYAEAGYAFCSERALDTLGVYLLGGLARVEFLAGHWDLAAELATKTVRDPRTAPAPRVWALGVLGLIRARRGDPEASAPLETAHEIVSPTGQIEWMAPIAAARAEAAWLVGDHGAIDGLTTAAFELARERRDLRSIGELAFWRRQAGLHDALPTGVPEPYASMLVGNSMRAAERWTAIGFPYEAALALAEDDDPLALREAIEELQRLGAQASVAVVARRARARGVRGLPRGPRRQTRENPAGLTARELEVLALVADGLRNAEIAQRLVVSPKTVDHHVSAVLRKLDVRHRGEVRAAAARLGLHQ